MKAVIYERYGPPSVLELRDVEKPVAEGNRVLIRTRAVSVNKSDWEALTARPVYVRIGGAGFLRPNKPILGSDIAGVVEAVGEEVTRFEPGDEVVGDFLYYGSGGFAEYVSVREGAPLVKKPQGMSFEEASAIPQGALLALQGLRDRRQVEAGQHVLINGAGGAGGTFAIQIAKSLGAEVTAVDHSGKLALMRSIGADHVIDYTEQDFTKGGTKYDHILDFVGSRSIFACARALQPDGVYAMVGGSIPRLLQAFTVGRLISRFGDKDLAVLLARPNREDLSYLVGLVDEGELKPVIDGPHELPDVPDVMARIGAGQVMGKAVITV